MNIFKISALILLTATAGMAAAEPSQAIKKMNQRGAPAEFISPDANRNPSSKIDTVRSTMKRGDNTNDSVEIAHVNRSAKHRMRFS